MTSSVHSLALFIRCTSEFLLCSGDTKINKADSSFSWVLQTVFTIGYLTVYGMCSERGQLQELTG